MSVNGVSVSRLMALGLLAERGPMHGHRVRREAEDKNVEAWGGVSIGALYRELHQLARDGLVTRVCSERVGGRPERTVYRITEEGRKELAILRERAMADVARRPDPLGVALLFTGPGDPGEMAERLRLRRQALETRLRCLRSERDRLSATAALSRTALAVFRRNELLLQAELAWHQECAAEVADHLGPASVGAEREDLEVSG